MNVQGHRLAVEDVEASGHLIDSLVLPKILDKILEAGAEYQITDLVVGASSSDPSFIRLQLRADTASQLDSLITDLQVHGVNRTSWEDAELAECPADGVLPDRFYSTTNLASEIRLDGRWHPIAGEEMDCAVVVRAGQARSVPIHQICRGDAVAVGQRGIRVTSAPPRDRAQSFAFMDSDASSEKARHVQLRRLASRMRAVKAEGGRILVVVGPAVIHTGAGPQLASIIRSGFVDVLFAGNGFATHDIETNLYGTSLGISTSIGRPVPGGHANHLRAINLIRSFGSIAAAVTAGALSGGVMYECCRRKVSFVLAGSIRDDGPLPDVVTDVLVAADLMRAQIAGVRLVLMLATTLHAIATGNLLPASVETYCIDINQAVVTKLSDRGSHQAIGIVTDVGLFLGQLVAVLSTDE